MDMEIDSNISDEEYTGMDEDPVLIVSGDELDRDDEDEEIPLFDVPDESSATILSIDSPLCCVDIDPTRRGRILFGGCDDKAYLSNLPENPVCSNEQGTERPSLGFEKVFQDHSDTVSCASYSTDGKYFATGGCDGTIRVYGNEASNEGQLISILEGPSDELEFIRWHPRGPCIFGGGVDGTGWIWMASDGRVLSVLSGHGDSITCGDFSNEGKIVCTGSLDGSVIIWNPKNGESLHKITRNCFVNNAGDSSYLEELGIVSMRSHKKSPLLAVGFTNGLFSLIQPETGKVLSLNNRHHYSLDCIEFINNLEDPLLATGDMSGELIVWNYEYNRENFVMRNQELEHSNGVLPGITSICWGGDRNNTLIATGCLDGTIRLWDFRTGENVKILRGHKSGILSMKIVEFGFQGTNVLRMVSTGDDGRCLLWDVRM
ncbi:WD domain G-beta repeat family protein [Cryptosporidium meleagridis]|uniref:WD domain G-beta repeat family protein n=1 Tax=Cryptosporidium meleagridis TaxID=93969 RepID=A0A2P4Z100_9CRYT|nr:WD domain G-beta repeat family protein [Cryptosporidium meleagridis]